MIFNKITHTIFFLCLLPVFSFTGIYAQGGGQPIVYTTDDRDRAIRMEIKMEELNKQLEKRFEIMEKRLEQTEKRIEDLRSDMNARFEQQFTFLWIITGIFTAIMVAAISLAIWDRRTIIDYSIQKSFEKSEKEGSYLKLLSALKQLAATNPEVAQALRQYNLL